MKNKKNGLVVDGGVRFWYKEGNLHREDGPAVEYENGDKEWYINGQRHRIGSPAVELMTGYKEWYEYDMLHRDDGPAVEYVSGEKEWWTRGRKSNEERVLSLYQKRILSGEIQSSSAVKKIKV